MTNTSAGDKASGALDGMGKTVLVVEDNPTNLKLFHDLLDSQGYAVLQATNGMEGLRMAQEHRPDLIVMDIQLPGISGLDVTKQLKSDETLKAIPVIAVTAFAMRGDEEKLLENGCDAYISKPISITDFLQTIERFMPEWSPSPAEDSSDLIQSAK